MSVQPTAGPHVWNRTRIFIGLALCAGALLAVAAKCAHNDNPDNWMSMEPDACTCQGTTLHCDSEGTQDFPDSKYCDQSYLNQNVGCSCSGTTLSCVFVVDFVANSGYAIYTPTPSSENLIGGHTAVQTFLNSPVCIDGTAQPIDRPTQPSEEATRPVDQATATAEVSTQGPPPACTPNPGDGICSACENTDLDSAACVCNMNGVCDPQEGFNCGDCAPTALPTGEKPDGGGRKPPACTDPAGCP